MPIGKAPLSDCLSSSRSIWSGSADAHVPSLTRIINGGMSMMKYLMGTAIVASLMALSATGAAADKLTLALVPKNMNNPFFDQARDGCKKAEAESNGAFECMYIGPGEHGGGEEQVQIVQDLIAKKVAGIAVAPANAAAMALARKAAKAPTIPAPPWGWAGLPQ